jgi:hypothetical protein
MHRKVAAALVAVLALGIASCGGSEQTTLTRAELVRRVELACREGQLEGQRQTRASRGANDRSTFIEAVLASQRTIMDKVDDFTASGAAKTDFDTFKAGLQTRLDGIERIASADRADQQRMIRAEQARLEAAGRRIQEAARDLGIEGCS